MITRAANRGGAVIYAWCHDAPTIVPPPGRSRCRTIPPSWTQYKYPHARSDRDLPARTAFARHAHEGEPRRPRSNSRSRPLRPPPTVGPGVTPIAIFLKKRRGRPAISIVPPGDPSSSKFKVSSSHFQGQSCARAGCAQMSGGENINKSYSYRKLKLIDRLALEDWDIVRLGMMCCRTPG